MTRKKQVFFIFSGIIVCFLCVFYLKKDQNTHKKIKKQDIKLSFSIKTVKNDIQEFEQILSGEICDFPQHEISFDVDGVLMLGDTLLVPGMEFKKNQLLYRIDNNQSFAQLVSKKNELIKLFSFILPQLEAKFPNHNGKWQSFLDGIKPTKLLPDYPLLFTPEERVFLVEKEFIQAYVKTKMLEKEMEKYFFLAPFDGIFIESIIQPGESVTSGASIAKIEEKTDLTAKIIVPKKELKNYIQLKHVHFVNRNSKITGNGRFIKSTKHKEKSHFVEIYYSVQSNSKTTLIPRQSIKIVTYHLTKEKCIMVPNLSIVENHATILIDNVPAKKPVKIIAQNKKSIYIVGLKDGDQLILKN